MSYPNYNLFLKHKKCCVDHLNGERGDEGIKGKHGENGNIGPVGPIGPQGDVGVTGVTGPGKISTFNFYSTGQQIKRIADQSLVPISQGYIQTTASVFKGGTEPGANYYEHNTILENDTQNIDSASAVANQIDSYVMPYRGRIIAITASQKSIAPGNSFPEILNEFGFEEDCIIHNGIEPHINGILPVDVPVLCKGGSGVDTSGEGITYKSSAHAVLFNAGDGLQVLIKPKPHTPPPAYIYYDIQVTVSVQFT